MRINRSRALAFVSSALLATTFGMLLGNQYRARSSAAAPIEEAPSPPPNQDEFWKSQPAPNELDDRVSIARAIAQLPASALPDIVAEAYENARGAGDKALDFRTSAALVRWAKNDPFAAMRWAEQLVNKTQRELVQKDIVTLWGVTDPSGLGDWLEVSARAFEKRSRRLSRELRRRAFGALRDSDPVRAISLAGKIGGTQFLGHKTSEAIRDASTAAAAADAAMNLEQGAFTFQGGSTDGGEYQSGGTSSEYARYSSPGLLDGIAERWDALDPEAYNEAVASGRFRPARYPVKVARFALEPEETYQAATERTLASAATPQNRREVLFAAINKWAAEDSIAAGTWLGEQDLADDPDTWPAVRSFARAAARQDPDGALAWIELIGDEHIRSGAFIDAATAWGRAHPDSPHDTSAWPPRLANAWAALSATARR